MHFNVNEQATSLTPLDFHTFYQPLEPVETFFFEFFFFKKYCQAPQVFQPTSIWEC
jgi:hypothetical protein